MLHLVQMGMETLSGVAFQGLGSLHVLVLDRETGLLLDGSLQDHSPQVPPYIHILGASLTRQCANTWVGPWLGWSSRTCMHIVSHQLHQPEVGGCPKNLFSPFSGATAPRLWGWNSFWAALLCCFFRSPCLSYGKPGTLGSFVFRPYSGRGFRI